jgi:dTDP-4-dehydrorhamnose reductase
MKIFILGATGMLGHKLMQELSRSFDVVGTVRCSATKYATHPILAQMSLLGDVQAENFDSVIGALASSQPDLVINCIGIIKQQPSAKSPLPSIAINSLFPHRLAMLCRAMGTRLIHISTDCVFSGRKGNYTEDDISDVEDLYGRTKLLGEVTYPGCITIRTSIIGRELYSRLGLIEWFISRRGGNVQGFAGAIYTGFTTKAMASIIGDIIQKHPDLSGLWHVSSYPISKYELLKLVNHEFKLGIKIEKDTKFKCDRSMNSSRFRRATGFMPPKWDDMIAEMAADSTTYDALK